jgi:hypothetical protein
MLRGKIVTGSYPSSIMHPKTQCSNALERKVVQPRYSSDSTLLSVSISSWAVPAIKNGCAGRTLQCVASVTIHIYYRLSVSKSAGTIVQSQDQCLSTADTRTNLFLEVYSPQCALPSHVSRTATRMACKLVLAHNSGRGASI